VRYDRDPLYRQWVRDLWEKNWMEGNALFAWMTRVMLGEETAHWEEARRSAIDTLERFPRDRVFRPVMNSLRQDLDRSKPLPIDQRPLDNEYEWKGDPYRLDGWLKPTITAFQTACDDPQVAWFSDVTGRVYLSLDGWRTWRDVSPGLMGAQVRNLAASSQRTFVLWADTDQGVKITRDGGLSWRSMPQGEAPPQFPRSADPAGRVKSFTGWRIPVVRAVFSTPRGLLPAGRAGRISPRTARTGTN
jgi:hypothetical protein